MALACAVQSSVFKPQQKITSMAKLIRVLKTLRNNWKKTTFGVLVLSYGVDYGYTKYKYNFSLI